MFLLLLPVFVAAIPAVAVGGTVSRGGGKGVHVFAAGAAVTTGVVAVGERLLSVDDESAPAGAAAAAVEEDSS